MKVTEAAITGFFREEGANIGSPEGVRVTSKKGPRMGPFSGEADLLVKPSFDDIGSVFRFPLFQAL